MYEMFRAKTLYRIEDCVKRSYYYSAALYEKIIFVRSRNRPLWVVESCGVKVSPVLIDSLKLRVIYDNLCWSRHAGISRKSRSLFLELDATAAKTGRPVTPVHPKTPTETSRRARDVSWISFIYIYSINPRLSFEIMQTYIFLPKLCRE